MKKKKIIFVLSIISILIISFFIGGNQEVVPLDAENPPYLEENVALQDNEAKSTLDYDEETSKPQEKNEEEDKSEEINALEKKDESEKVNEEAPTETKKTKDPYNTDPVPPDKPEPVEWQDATIDEEKELTATLSVTCKTILNNMDMFNEDKLEVLPEDGIIYSEQTVIFYEGESVFDVLLREMQENKIHMSFRMTPIYNSNYVEGINNIYEFDCGELSGWMYRVNDWFPNYGASRYKLEDGDVIEWIYTCDLGRDIGGDWAVTGGEE